MPESVKDEGLKEAYTEANQQNWTKEELEDYQRASIKERDEIGRIEFAEKKGKIKGKIEGKIESKIEMVRLMKADGETTEKIIRYTGLTNDEIEKL